MKLTITMILAIANISLCFAAGNPLAGQSRAIICFGCHEMDGNSTQDQFPKLAQQGEAYLAKQLRDFKKGRRVEEHMSSMVEAINETDIDDIAAYFSAQQRRMNNKNASVSITGKKIFQHGASERAIPACATCHGPAGTGNADRKYPLLAGQHKAYLLKTLNAFRNHSRSNDPNRIMQMIAEKLTDKEIDAIASYLSSLP